VKRTSSERASSIYSNSYSASTDDTEGFNASVSDIKTGYVHLLKNQTLAEISELLEQKPHLNILVMGFLENGIMPSKIGDETKLLEFFLFNRRSQRQVP
jgi:hypothetical protein